MRTDIVRTYKDVHSWVGIVCGLALFIAFYAGAITMFETPLQRWASAPSALAPAPSLQDAPRLVDAVHAAHPETQKAYTVHIRTGPENPARVSWSTGGGRGGGEHGPQTRQGASFDDAGALVDAPLAPSPVAQLVDTLHQQVGLPLPREIAMPIMGAVALLYVVALVSGLIALLPSLVKDLFALRAGKNLKRMWLDVHNALGLFSFPFHLVMALTAIVFAFHDQFYDAQNVVIYENRLDDQWAQGRPPPVAPGRPLLTPQALLDRIAEQAPGFVVTDIEYRKSPNGAYLARAMGYDPRFGMRAPTFGYANADPYDGAIVQADYLPGHQTGWVATVTSFFTLHFGSYGGDPIRWGYVILGLAGAFMLYTGNLLWIESRRKRITRHAPEAPQSTSSYVLGCLTIGIALGCVAGISTTIAASKWLPGRVGDLEAWHSWIYYAVFVAATLWAFVRGPARGAIDLLVLCAIATALIPLSSLTAAVAPAAGAWSWADWTVLVDITAGVGALCFAFFAYLTAKRAYTGPRDSIWSVHALKTARQAETTEGVS